MAEMVQTNDLSLQKRKPCLLILRKLSFWQIVGAELRRVTALGRYMATEGIVRSEHIAALASSELTDDDTAERLRMLATVCEELRPDSLYARYGRKDTFRRESDFWAADDDLLKTHVKKMADQRLLKALQLADTLDIPIIYAPAQNSSLHIENRLHLCENCKVTPVMCFSRHSQGISYQLQLRIDHTLMPTPSEQHLVVLGYVPGIFILGRRLLVLDQGFSGKLLLPFVNKAVVEIPQRMENDYFHRFILRNVTKAEIVAEGFHIEDCDVQPRPCLNMEKTVDNYHLLSLRFRYDNMEYAPDSLSHGRVTLVETPLDSNATDGERTQSRSFRFVRQLRDKKREQTFINYLKELTATCGMALLSDSYLRFPDLRQMVDWLREYAPRLRDMGFDVIQPSDKVYYIGSLNVEQSDTWVGDWLQTEVTIVLEDGKLRIPFRDLRDTILQGEQEYMLPTGQRLIIPAEWLQRYSDLLFIGLPKGKGLERHRCQLVALSNIEEPNTQTFQQPLLTQVPAPATLKATLRPYQWEGYQWLWRNFISHTGCCLSDEMGLGKTLQTITLMLKYKATATPSVPRQPLPGFLFTEEEMGGTAATTSVEPQVEGNEVFRTMLVVAPASVVYNWRNELHRFAPSLLVCIYTGDQTHRRALQQGLMKADVVVTTYRMLVNDIGFFSAQQFGIVVYDESQAFKTATSQIHKAVSRIHASHHLALSGTPVENNLMELWSLMNVLNPSLLGSAKNFQQCFVTPIARNMETERTVLLRRLIAPYFLKRTKEEVLRDLPERQDEVVVCPMTERQISQYAEILSRARNEWMASEKDKSNKGYQIQIIATIQRLRQIANGEGKIEVVTDQLRQLRGTKHKVLIFSEYVKMLERMGNLMEQFGWSYALLTGETQRREQVIEHFQTDPHCQFFLISLKAGGVGLNLTAADYVMLLDPWWNHAAEEQAIARAHRIGQHHPVFVYRFVSENTLEQQILSLQERKQSLIDSVMPFLLNEKQSCLE